MLGQAQTPLRRLLGIAAAALVVLTLPTVGGADPSQSERYDLAGSYLMLTDGLMRYATRRREKR